MSEEKLLGAIDAIEAKINDYKKSTEAANAARTEGEKKVEAFIAEQRKTNQEMAEMIRKGIPAEKKDVNVAFGELIKSFVMHKAASEGTAADGGYVVPDEFATEIRSAQNQYGAVRQIWGNQIYPMKSDVCYVPTDTYEDTDANAPVPASTAENAAISESNVAQLNQVTLTAAKYATLSYISNELVSDASLIGGGYVGGFLLPKLARKKSKTEDSVVFTTATTGILKYTSLQKITFVQGDTSFNDLTFDYLQDAIDQVADDASMDGKFYLHKTLIGLVRKLQGTDKHPIWAPAAGAEPATILGEEYMKCAIFPKLSDTAADTCLGVYGNLPMGMIVGERPTIGIASSPDFRFNYDQLAIRMTFRIAYGSNADIGRAICRIVTAAA